MKPSAVAGVVVALLLALAPQGTAAAATASAAKPVAYTGSTTDPRGNVTAVVPGSSIAREDGLTHLLEGDHSYRAEFLVWVAPNVRNASVVLHADGAVLSDCTSLHLRPGATSAVMCLVRGDPKSGHDVSIDVVVRTSNLGSFSRTFTHALVG